MGMLEYFCPDMCVRGINDIDLAELKASGYECLILDLDNTLLPWQITQVPYSTKKWVETAKQMGWKLCIVSNTHNPVRLKTVANELDIFSVPRAIKPRQEGFEQAIKLMEVLPESAVVIGDQVLTDVLGGNLMCMYTILVEPMHPKEFIGTKISRIVEKVILSLLRKKGLLGTISGSNKSERRDTK